MRILIVAPFLPYPPDTGGNIRIFELLRRGASRNRQDLLCYHEPRRMADALPLSAYCRPYLLGFPRHRRKAVFHLQYLFSPFPYSLGIRDPRFERTFTRLLQQETYDVVQFEFLPMAHYARLIPPTVRKVAVVHYLASESRRRLMRIWPASIRKIYYRWELPKIRRYERQVIDSMDLCIVTSEEHLRRLRRWGVRARLALVPNGVDTTYFTPPNPDGARRGDYGDPKLVYMGAFHLEPANIDGLVYLLEEIWPRIRRTVPQVGLDVIGKGLPAKFIEHHRNPGIRFHGYLQDIRPTLSAADAFVIPLRGGSGTKLRILTAMAMGIPVVATPAAVAGLDVKYGEEILVGADAGEIAGHVTALLHDRQLRQRIGSSGRRLVCRRYDWRQAARALDAAYETLRLPSAGQALP